MPLEKPDRKRKSKVPKNSARAMVNREAALALRAAGASYPAIGRALGVSTRTAHRAVVGAYEDLAKQCPEKAELALAIDLERCDQIILSHWNQRADNSHAATIMRVIDRRARYFGLDAPEKTELSGPNGGPIQTEDITEKLCAKLFPVNS